MFLHLFWIITTINVLQTDILYFLCLFWSPLEGQHGGPVLGTQQWCHSKNFQKVTTGPRHFSVRNWHHHQQPDRPARRHRYQRVPRYVQFLTILGVGNICYLYAPNTIPTFKTSNAITDHMVSVWNNKEAFSYIFIYINCSLYKGILCSVLRNYSVPKVWNILEGWEK